MIYKQENFINDYNADIIINKIGPYYKPDIVDEETLNQTQDAFGFDPATMEASYWTLQNPIAAYNDDYEHDSMLKYLHNIYIQAQNALKKAYALFAVDALNDTTQNAIVFLSSKEVDFTGGSLIINQTEIVVPEKNMLICFDGNYEFEPMQSGEQVVVLMSFLSQNKTFRLLDFKIQKITPLIK
jgi:hypothetical protein